MTSYAVHYSGGSGGFMFYWSLQLALGYDVKEQIAANWDIEDYDTWRDNEQADFYERSTVNDVTICCNLLELYPNVDKTILLYTDIDTQLTLATLKNAKWFAPERTSMEWHLLQYNKVKDPTWPEVTTVDELFNLPDHITDELVNDFEFALTEKIKTSSIMSNTIMFNGHKTCDLVGKLSNADHIFRLQDVISTKFKCVTDALGLAHTQEVADHIDMWVNLHPENIQAVLRSDI